MAPLPGCISGSGSELCPAPTPVPDNPYQRPEGRDLGPENIILVGLTILGRPRSSKDARPYPMQLCRDAVLTLPITAAGTWSRLPKADRLTPERPMPCWPSPVTQKNNSRSILSGFRSLFECCPYLFLFLVNRALGPLGLFLNYFPANCRSHDSTQRTPKSE